MESKKLTRPPYCESRPAKTASVSSGALALAPFSSRCPCKTATASWLSRTRLERRAGPARHLHVDQDEWFYALEGEFIVEVGEERIRLNPGDSLLAPRRVPHVWACVGDTRGRMLIAFMPAGKMEAFFREVTKANAMPPQDPELWRAHGMGLLGPRLPVA
jgi:mannose-6-phosphate isomerase-like protein (cupin superfamily)